MALAVLYMCLCAPFLSKMAQKCAKIWSKFVHKFSSIFEHSRFGRFFDQKKQDWSASVVVGRVRFTVRAPFLPKQRYGARTWRGYSALWGCEIRLRESDSQNCCDNKIYFKSLLIRVWVKNSGVVHSAVHFTPPCQITLAHKNPHLVWNAFSLTRSFGYFDQVISGNAVTQNIKN